MPKKPQKILMIDDEMIWLERFREFLGDAYEVIGATSLPDAWHVIQETPDIKLAIVDLVLPTYEDENKTNDYAGISLLVVEMGSGRAKLLKCLQL